MIAARAGQVESARLLMDYGARINARDTTTTCYATRCTPAARGDRIGTSCAAAPAAHDTTADRPGTDPTSDTPAASA